MENLTIEKTEKRLTEKRWILPDVPNASNLTELLQIPGLHPVVARILALRGIENEAMLRSFFNPHLDDLHDPFLMKDMDKAVERIAQAIHQNEGILVFGDYDVDGTTATSLVYRYLGFWHSNLSYYIPDRYKEGYGISFAGIDAAAERGASLIIALDCGIKAMDQVAYATSKGIDFIICDHHLPGPVLPEAIAVLDPKRKDCSYPYKELSGCGVGFKLLQALVLKMNWDEDALLAHLDLVAVSIAADIVPITGENRILMELGLRQINQSPSPGLEALMQVSGFKPEPDGKYQLKGDRLVFGLGPRINAAGRIGHGSGAVELLTSNTLDEALEKASRMDDQNGERKELDKSITMEALSMISGDPEKQGAYTSVLFQAHWHKGVIGIVASRCIEQYYKPTTVLTESNGKLTGSGRSIFGFDLYAALDACREHLIQFGGHYFAAGLTLYPEQLDGFVKAFEAQARMRLQPDDLQARVVLDAELPLGQINQRLFQQIQRLGPFGPQNMNPLFVAFGVRDNGFSRLLDSKSGGAGHIKFSLSHPDLVYEGRPYALDGIGFGLAGYWPLVVSGEPFDIAFHLEENTFRERTTLQLTVKEIRPHQTENS